MAGGCGYDLGSFQIVNIRRVDQMPASLFSAGAPDYGSYLRIELSSPLNLNAPEARGAGLYVHARPCAESTRDRLIAFGPFGTGGQLIDRQPGVTSLAKARDGGSHRYVVYLVPTWQPRKAEGLALTLAPYDLARTPQDTCLHFTVPGYNLTETRSQMIRLSGQQIARALTGG